MGIFPKVRGENKKMFELPPPVCKFSECQQGVSIQPAMLRHLPQPLEVNPWLEAPGERHLIDFTPDVIEIFDQLMVNCFSQPNRLTSHLKVFEGNLHP